MIYADRNINPKATTAGDAGTSIHHPYSYARRVDSPQPVCQPEMAHTNTATIGLFRPPLEYIPGETGWKHHERGWESALSAALSQHNVTMTADQIRTELENLLKDPKKNNDRSSLLYDPADRNTAVFQGEPDASFMAAHAVKDHPFSLVIICPWVRADGIDWERIYDTHNRPPIYSRWSTGDQAVYEPIVLMCLPQLETKAGRESYKKAVDWFSVLPKKAFEEDLKFISDR